MTTKWQILSNMQPVIKFVEISKKYEHFTNLIPVDEYMTI